MVVRRKDGFYVVSESGKNLGGPFTSRGDAVERLKTVEMFKHLAKKKKDKEDSTK